MATIVRSAAALTAVFVVAAGIAAENNTSVVPKNAIDALLTRLDKISRDADMTTAKKAFVAADAVQKFNQQYKGKTLTVRLKIQDVVPHGQGYYLTANRPDLDGVQFYASKFQANLSKTDVMSVTKESVLAVTGRSARAVSRRRNSCPAFSSRGAASPFPCANSAWRICLDNVAYQLEAAPKTKADVPSAAAASASDFPLLTPGKTSGESHPPATRARPRMTRLGMNRRGALTTSSRSSLRAS